MTTTRMCQLGGVSRSGYYRFRAAGQTPDRDLEVRAEIHDIVVEMPGYGRPRVTKELRRRGWVINHKRVRRILRQDNLLCLRKRRFVLTTDSKHGLPVYPNLANSMVLTGINQLWAADITYIRLLNEFIFLAVLLDVFSRRCIGWAVDQSLHAELALAALRMALKNRRPPPSLVHHSDQGVQYASHDYVAELNRQGIQISMSRKANPYDNAFAESFIKTLKYEEVYRQDYRDLRDVMKSLPRFIEQIYNRKRLHSALGFVPPAEFEEHLKS